MTTNRLLAASVVAASALATLSCGGGGGDAVTPPQVASVVITAPATAPTFGALGRTAQFAAEARDANGGIVTGVTLTWSSGASGVASVNTSGLVTALANGSTTITASAGGKTSTGVTVTVAQVGASATLSPTSPAMGALGSTRQFSVQLLDSTAHALPSPNPVVWSVSANGTISVSNAGLVTALANTVLGSADSVAALVGPTAIRVATPVIVTQVPASIVLAVPGGDSVLRTTGRTRQFTATVRDSNTNALVTQPALIWTVTVSGAVSVNNVGLVTAISDGTSSVNAFAGNASASRAQVVQRYAETFTLVPTTASITTNGGTQLFTGTAQDTSGASLVIAWLSRAPTIATVSPAAGLSTTATAVSNGSTRIVMSGGMRTDSASLTVSGQTGVMALTVNVGDNFFKSVRNNTQNPARDTISAGGTVTWTWVGSANHSVQSTGSPSFTSSTIKATGTYQFTFNTPGTYAYDCAVHGAAMTGIIVVQ